MAITQEQIAERLKAAREATGLSQQEVAESLGIPRTAVVQFEAGKRGISSLELERLARLYGRGMGDFVSAEEFTESPVTALFRAASPVAAPRVLKQDLPRIEWLCREAVSLEQLLGRDQTKAPLVQYDPVPPANRWDAILQGRQIAAQERQRLGLGIAPVWEIAELIKRQGIRVVEVALADDVSGLFLYGRSIGSIIVVNSGHPDSRKLFSCAHEYCHALVDRSTPSAVSRTANREEFHEIRANAFAAYFLMPEEGVRRYLDQIGKGPESRMIHHVYGSADGEEKQEELAAQKRSISVRQDLQLYDLIGIADAFGVSVDAALYHLLNLKLLHRNRFDELKSRKAELKGIRTALSLPERRFELGWLLTNQVLELGFEAYRRDLISKGKLVHVAKDLGIQRETIERVVEGWAPTG